MGLVVPCSCISFEHKHIGRAPPHMAREHKNCQNKFSKNSEASVKPFSTLVNFPTENKLSEIC